MKIAIASGKGGTGKTFVATNLFYALQQAKIPVTIVDCDAEEPNVHLFISGCLTKSFDVTQKVPVINESICTHCGRCHKYCSYNAIFHVPTLQVIKVMEDLCHGCGACFVACNDSAITEKQSVLGTVKRFDLANQFTMIEGRTKIGVYSSVKLIKAAIAEAGSDSVVLFDSPPGTSCPFIQTAHLADFVVLVTEPTPFGLSDLKQSVETLADMNKPMGVVVNRAGIGNSDVYNYLKEKKIPLLMEIPFSREIALTYSKGLLISAMDEVWLGKFRQLFDTLTPHSWK
ncbi:MAG: hypothetical protein A2W93_04345 [Bacteroidetes bacterium GWF2_43_63]|nr:MAG: hypothetical protein A2W94_12335 [Bacteroidetes bacterium GWE2_42_42]OFY56091.1 MAG: hypothetical protein A2W93_04345 [Bacteroidetes bacterium GWF2_43_63]